MKYKEYVMLLESDSDGDVYRKEITLEEALKIYLNQCDENHHLDIFRGIEPYNPSKKYGVYNIIEGQKGGRKSANTSNHYTVILDELIKERDEKLPLRSKSIIVSESINYASEYGEVYRVVPYNGVTIGVVPSNDIWRVDIEGYKLNIINKMLSDVGVEATTIKNMAKQIESLNDEDFGKLQDIFKKGEVEKSIRELYDLDKLGFKFVKSGSYNTNNHNELWIGGKCLLLEEKIFKIFSRMKSTNIVLVKHTGNDYGDINDYSEVFVEPKVKLNLDNADNVINLDELDIVNLDVDYDDEFLPMEFYKKINRYVDGEHKNIITKMLHDYKGEDEKYSVWVLLTSFRDEMIDVMKKLSIDGFKWRHGDKNVYMIKKGMVK